MFLDRVQGFLRKPFLYANACEDAEALGFDKDLTFFTFPGADLVAVGIVGPEELNITVQMYPCSEGTDTGNPVL